MLQRQQNIALRIINVNKYEIPSLAECRMSRSSKKYDKLIEENCELVPNTLPCIGMFRIPLCHTTRSKNSFFNKMPGIFNAK